MAKKQFPTLESIIKHLNIAYSLDVTSLIPLLIGADKDASVYQAKTSGKDSYFIKLKADNSCFYPSVIMWLQQQGISRVLPVIKTARDKLYERINGFTLTVFPFVTGENGFNRALTEEQWILLGKTLKKIHQIKVPNWIKNNIRQETYSSQWHQAIETLYIRINTEQSSDEIGTAFCAFMNQQATTLRRLTTRAEQLAQTIPKKSIPFVFCHGDLHAGNVLLDDNNSFYIVDWDNPIMAPKERDLMFIGGGVGNVWNKINEQDLFYQGYGEIEINSLILSYYRFERIIEDIVLFGQQLLDKTCDDGIRAESYKEFIGQFEPTGVVEIAFKTGEKLVM